MFIVYDYESDFTLSSDFDPDRKEFETLKEARLDVIRRLGDRDEWRIWGGHEDDYSSDLIEVEAYRESREAGCGGVQISRPVK